MYNIRAVNKNDEHGPNLCISEIKVNVVVHVQIEVQGMYKYKATISSAEPILSSNLNPCPKTYLTPLVSTRTVPNTSILQASRGISVQLRSLRLALFSETHHYSYHSILQTVCDKNSQNKIWLI